MSAPLRIAAFLEANSITGPAKNLIDFGIYARQLSGQDTPLDLSVVTFRRPHNPTTDPFLDATAKAGIPCHILFENSPFDLKSVLAIRRLILRLNPDIVQTHNVKAHFLFWLSGLSRRYPWVAWHHGYTIPTIKQAIYNRFNFLTLRWARHVVSVTGAFERQLLDDGVRKENISVIRNAIQPGWIEDPLIPPPQLPRQAICPPTTRIVLSVGRLSREKAHSDLIEAIALAAQSSPALPPLHLLLVGDGPEADPLRKLASLRKVPLTITGQVPDSRPYYALADLFVLSSLTEGSPNVLIEAMACALPIVATRVGGVPETAFHLQDAWLAQPASPPSLAEGIVKLLSNPGLASSLASAAQLHVSQNFLPTPRAKEISALYTRLLASPHP